MEHTELQQLTARYASGELDKSSYRSQRKELIDRITGVQIQPQQAPAQIQNLTEPVPPPNEPVDSRIRLAVALLALLITLGVLVYFTMPDG